MLGSWNTKIAKIWFAVKELIVYKTKRKGTYPHTHFIYLCIHQILIVYSELDTSIDIGLTVKVSHTLLRVHSLSAKLRIIKQMNASL